MPVDGVTVSALLSLLAGALLLGAGVGFVFGLYFGERGRRKDAQRREGVLKVDPIEPATITAPGAGVAAPVEAEFEEAKEKFIQETMAEVDCSREVAEAEWNDLIGRGMGDTSTGWTQELGT